MFQSSQPLWVHASDASLMAVACRAWCCSPSSSRRLPHTQTARLAPLLPQLLTRYYATHGCGLVSQHSVFVWSGKLQAQDVLKGGGAAAGSHSTYLIVNGAGWPNEPPSAILM